jgi:WD40 repeat protein
MLQVKIKGADEGLRGLMISRDFRYQGFRRYNSIDKRLSEVTFVLHDEQTGKERVVEKVTGFLDNIRPQVLGFDKQGTRLFTAFTDLGFGIEEQGPGIIKIWDVTTGKKIKEWQAVAMNGDSHFLHVRDNLFAISTAGVVEVWDVQNDKVAASLTGDDLVFLDDRQPLPATCSEFIVAPDSGKFMYIGWDNSTLDVYDTTTWKKVNHIKNCAGRWGACSPDGEYLYTGYDRLQVWEPQTGKLVREFEKGPHRVSNISLSRDGKTLAVAYCNNGGDQPGTSQVIVYEVPEGKKLWTIQRDKLERAE